MAIKEIVIGRASDGRPIVKRIDTTKEINKENKKEHQLDSRIKELKKRGYNESNIFYMLDGGRGKITRKRIQQGIKTKNVRATGQL